MSHLFDPAEAMKYVQKAVEETNRGQFMEAVACYEIALAHDPDNVNILLVRGFFYTDSMKDADSALPSFEKAIELDPKSAEAEYGVGLVRYMQDEYDDAIVHFGRAIALKPDYQNALVNHGSILCMQKRYQEAIPDLEAGLKLDPEDSIAWSSLAEARKAIGDLNGARAAAKQAIKFNPFDSDSAALLRQLEKASAKKAPKKASVKKAPKKASVKKAPKKASVKKAPKKASVKKAPKKKALKKKQR